MKSHSTLLVLFLAALPAMADTRFQIRRMTRNDVPAGKGQCDIRLQVDNEVEVSLRGDLLAIRTFAGRDARDDGSECNAPLPNHDVQGFNFEVIERRGDIRLVAGPSRKNDFSAVVTIHDNSGGEGRYHFRISWAMTPTDYRPGPESEHSPRRDDAFERPRTGEGFSWNNTVSFRGDGRGVASLSGGGDMRLGQVSIDIDRGGKMVASFRVDRGRPLAFTGQVLAQENGRWKIDVMSEDHRLRGPMWVTVDPSSKVSSVRMDATDGRDRMQLNWDRK
jgi:hypothetical protein